MNWKNVRHYTDGKKCAYILGDFNVNTLDELTGISLDIARHLLIYVYLITIENYRCSYKSGRKLVYFT